MFQLRSTDDNLLQPSIASVRTDGYTDSGLARLIGVSPLSQFHFLNNYLLLDLT